MEPVRIIRRVNNLEIIAKLMDSVAKQCDCRVKYNPQDGCIYFSGDSHYRKFIAEQTLAFFQAG